MKGSLILYVVLDTMGYMYDVGQITCTGISGASKEPMNTHRSVTRVDLSVPLMHHHLTNLGSLILIQSMSKE